MRHLARGAAALVLLCLTMLCLSEAAQAGTANLTWTLPTKNTDGSTITAPVTIKVYRATTQAGLATAPVLATTAAGATAYADATAPAGTVWYQISAVVNGQESARTGAVSTVVPEPVPNPPTGFAVVAVVAGVNVSPVYRILQDGTRGEQLAGFVDVGASCSGRAVFKYRGRTYRKVDPAAVRWWATRATDRVAAACG